MKTNSLLVLIMFFLSSQVFAALPEAPVLASEGIFATFGAHAKKAAFIKFDFMTKDIASKLGVSKSEMESYNHDLDQLNAMMTEISHELGMMKKPTIDDSVELWSGLKGAVSASTLAAIQKLFNRSK